MKMPFGKYKDEEICDIPIHYLKWVEENVAFLKKELRNEINHYIARSESDRPGAGLVKEPKEIKNHENHTIRLK